MRKLIICAIVPLALAGCNGMKASPIGLLPSAKLADAPGSCMAKPVVPPILKAGDDLAVDDAKVHAILGNEEDGKRACQNYIRRLNQGA